MKHVLSPADILFNRYMKTRMPSVLEAAVRVTGDLGMHKETDKAKQTAQSASEPQELAVLWQSAVTLGAARIWDPHGRGCPGRDTRAAGPEVGWHALTHLQKMLLKSQAGQALSSPAAVSRAELVPPEHCSAPLSAGAGGVGNFFGGPDLFPLSVETIINISFISDFEI